MVTETRFSGKRIVVFTDEKTVYNLLEKYLTHSFKIPYYKNGKITGVDFYYDVRFAKALKAILNGQIPLAI